MKGGARTMELADRLRFARGKAGLTLKDVEERTGIGPSSLSEYENGKREPKVAQLARLASAYHRSMGFFLDSGPIPAEVVLWRERPEGGAAAEVEGQFRLLCEQYHVLEVACDDVRRAALPAIGGREEVAGFRQAERLAYRTHQALGLGERPGPELLRVLEEVCGIKVFHLSFAPTGTAACTVDPSFGPALLLNRENARWRRNFDLAHELYHLITWGAFREGNATGGSEVVAEDEEKWANCFASALLMPTEAVRGAVDEAVREECIRFADLADIARGFDVSIEALVWRLVGLRVFETQRAKDLLQRFKANAELWDKQRARDDPPERPERFRALAVRALREGRLSIGRCAEYLGIDRSEAMRIAEEEVPDDDPIPVGDS